MQTGKKKFKCQTKFPFFKLWLIATFIHMEIILTSNKSRQPITEWTDPSEQVSVSDSAVFQIISSQPAAKKSPGTCRAANVLHRRVEEVS